MKSLQLAVPLFFALSTIGMSAEYKGFVEDQSCAAKPAMKANAQCAQKCIKGGSPAVLVAEDGKIYKIANQDKIVSHAGENVTVTGNLKDDTLTIEDVK